MNIRQIFEHTKLAAQTAFKLKPAENRYRNTIELLKEENVTSKLALNQATRRHFENRTVKNKQNGLIPQIQRENSCFSLTVQLFEPLKGNSLARKV